MRRTIQRSLAAAHTRSISSTSAVHAGVTGTTPSRAIVYAAHGDPSEVLRGHTYELKALKKGEVRVKFELSAINPADVNVIQGVYPVKPVVREDIGFEPLSIMGNEGVGTVEGFEEDGEVEKVLKVGDRVVMGSAQLGTWQSYANIPFASLIPVSSTPPISPAQAATLSINPPTALRMLSDFIPLNPKDNRGKPAKKQWVIQNGGNSAVGTAVIQIAREWGVGTINLVRNRDDLTELESHLKSLGADHVMTYDQFLEKSSRSQIKEWTKGGELRLALNCVGGKETTEMVKLLGQNAYLVTYGGMAKVALAVPPSLFIFKKLTAAGFWLSNWVKTHPKERITMINDLAQLVANGKLVEPATEVVELAGDDEAIGKTIRELMKKSERGRGKKALLKFV